MSSIVVSWTAAATSVRPRDSYSSERSRRTGVSAWHGGHHEAQKLTHTPRPRRAARLIGAPSRSVSWKVVPSERVTVNSGAMLPGVRPGLGGSRRYGVAGGAPGAPPPPGPGGRGAGPRG